MLISQINKSNDYSAILTIISAEMGMEQSEVRKLFSHDEIGEMINQGTSHVSSISDIVMSTTSQIGVDIKHINGVVSDIKTLALKHFHFLKYVCMVDGESLDDIFYTGRKVIYKADRYNVCCICGDQLVIYDTKVTISVPISEVGIILEDLNSSEMIELFLCIINMSKSNQQNFKVITGVFVDMFNLSYPKFLSLLPKEFVDKLETN
jgi:hypothetical protein